MSELFGNGRIIDLVLLGMLLEGAILLAIRQRTGRGLPGGQLAATLLSGGMLMLALRAALTGASWQVLAALMLASLVAHLFDLGLRLK